MTLRRFFLLACVYAFFGRDSARGQNTQPLSTPNAQCAIPFQFLAAGNSKVLDNRGAACLSFTLTASVPSTVSALSLVVQTAQDNGSANCSTCSWSTYTPSTGSNPLTSTTGGNATFVTAAGANYFEYLRVQLTSVTGTGTISGQLQGFLSGAPIAVTISGGGGCVGTLVTPCQVQVDGNAAVLANQQAVTAAAVPLATNTSKNACVKALIGNTINVYVGPLGVTNATGMELAPGEAVCLPVTNTNLLYVIASTTGASVSWIGTN